MRPARAVTRSTVSRVSWRPKSGTLLAYCEARKGTGSDWSTIDILMRRSTDGGKTWSEPQKIAHVDGPYSKNPAAVAQKLVKPDDVTYNNPVAIADRKTGAVHFLFCMEYMRCYYQRSDDDGRTFSRPVEITATLERFRKDYASPGTHSARPNRCGSYRQQHAQMDSGKPRGGLVGVPSARAANWHVPAGGWFNLEDAFGSHRFERVVSKRGAAGFAVGMPNFPAIYAIRAALPRLTELEIAARTSNAVQTRVRAAGWTVPLSRSQFARDTTPLVALATALRAVVCGILGRQLVKPGGLLVPKDRSGLHPTPDTPDTTTPGRARAPSWFSPSALRH